MASQKLKVHAMLIFRTHYAWLCGSGMLHVKQARGIITRYNGVHLAPVQLNEMHNKFQFYSTSHRSGQWQQQKLNIN